MPSRCARSQRKREVYYSANIDTFIERLKKVRALNCDPSDIGMDTYVLKRLSFNKLNILTRSL